MYNLLFFKVHPVTQWLTISLANCSSENVLTQASSTESLRLVSALLRGGKLSLHSKNWLFPHDSHTTKVSHWIASKTLEQKGNWPQIVTRATEILMLRFDQSCIYKVSSHPNAPISEVWWKRKTQKEEKLAIYLMAYTSSRKSTVRGLASCSR